MTLIQKIRLFNDLLQAQRNNSAMFNQERYKQFKELHETLAPIDCMSVLLNRIDELEDGRSTVNAQELAQDIRDALCMGPMLDLKDRLNKVFQKHFNHDFA